jgi:hypothetical protein
MDHHAPHLADRTRLMASRLSRSVAADSADWKCFTIKFITRISAKVTRRGPDGLEGHPEVALNQMRSLNDPSQFSPWGLPRYRFYSEARFRAEAVQASKIDIIYLLGLSG